MLTTVRGVRNAAAGLCAVLCLGCSSSATEFPLAYVHDDCAPWDGRALTLILTNTALESPFEPSFPHVRVTAWRPPATIAGGSFEWRGSAHDLGYATWCDLAESCSTATEVHVRFDRAQPSPDELVAQVHLVFEDGRVVEGAIRAVRLPHQMLCG